MPKFKIGDKVRATNACHEGYIATSGQVVTISGIDGYYFSIEEDCYELVESAKL